MVARAAAAKHRLPPITVRPGYAFPSPRGLSLSPLVVRRSHASPSHRFVEGAHRVYIWPRASGTTPDLDITAGSKTHFTAGF